MNPPNFQRPSSLLTPPALNLEGRVALITGAGSGIGAATAQLFCQAGARVGLLDLNAEGLQRTAESLAPYPCQFELFQTDTASAENMGAAFQKISEAWSTIDIVVANAGINGVWAPLDEITSEEWDRTMRVNLTGTFLTMKHSLPLMRSHGGSIIVISSINGTRVFSNSGATAYSCSKAALVALSKMTALELARDRIRVNVICPGSVATGIEHSMEQRHLDTIQPSVHYPRGEVPLTDGQGALPVRVAELALFLASDLSKHITGTEVYIDGAQSLLKG